MAKALADLNRKEQARKKAGMKGLTDLAGTALSFIPGAGPAIGAAVKGVGSLVTGDMEGAAAGASAAAKEATKEKDDSSNRDKKLDAIMEVLKKREQPVPTQGEDLAGKDMLGQLRPQEEIVEEEEEEEETY